MNTDREFRIPDPKFQSGSPRALRLCVFLGLLFAIAASVTAQGAPSKTPEKLDLNTATVEQLDKLPEVGPTLAKAIVRFREKSGPFRRVEDLLAVPGISKRRLEKIRPLVEVRQPEVRK